MAFLLLPLLRYSLVINWSVSIARIKSIGSKYDRFGKLSLIHCLGPLHQTAHWLDFRGVMLESSVHLGLTSDHQTESTFLVIGFVLT